MKGLSLQSTGRMIGQKLDGHGIPCQPQLRFCPTYEQLTEAIAELCHMSAWWSLSQTT